MPPTVSAKKPHIILIMTDQQRADASGCAGNDAIITPHLDSLAAQGHLFTNAYTAAPSSTPARAGPDRYDFWHHGLLGYARDIAPEYLVDAGNVLARQRLPHSRHRQDALAIAAVAQKF